MWALHFQGTIGMILRSVRKNKQIPEEVVELLEAIPQKTILTEDEEIINSNILPVAY